MNYPVPDNIVESLDLYVNNHIPTGDFLRAVLENNLMEAFGRADEYKRECLFNICHYIYNKLPMSCHGSPEKVRAWLKPVSDEELLTDHTGMSTDERNNM